ncbi:fumarylacetoacetate hydrolase family protein [Brevibacillus formosus]|uniref:Fumarylacetoacetase n=1 Tax=Brevibacillus formosus TaxID=54913 RepID=A0A837KVK9_9BACL|nr:fumarylacetoacetate hydrolase family protein [Brevibacillus formosus]KLI01223.1 fumarylacetoacetase [Brevibacillus formosus]MED1955752.1 fumarylacetoacetate hydrolase family protein [Brevibacillus formosus]PSK00093.1 fumarylacetoacetase [Brevibacillus formosus]GED59151.1 fumarylacetoacetase [Brevibacillus formosus]
MKLVSYREKERDAWRAGLVREGKVKDIAHACPGAPSTVLGLLEKWANWLPVIQTAYEAEEGWDLEQVELGSPLPRPASFRDFYAFEAHVKTARAKRGLPMVPEWYHFPVFYFSNAAAFTGTQANIRRPKATEWLDYELEIACVIGKAGINIPVERAEEHIAGYCILNDWSARDIQREEVKVGLGPAKGKDFATSMGPWMVTPEELADVRITGEKGSRYDLKMVARINGREYSNGNFKDIHYTFAEMIARASEDCSLYPGDVIGSGTVGTGCILELGTEQYAWLAPGDVVELEVERLGVLRNTICE